MFSFRIDRKLKLFSPSLPHQIHCGENIKASLFDLEFTSILKSYEDFFLLTLALDWSFFFIISIIN